VYKYWLIISAKRPVVSPTGERALDVIWPAASLQLGKRLSHRSQQGLRFLRVCWCHNDRPGM